MSETMQTVLIALLLIALLISGLILAVDALEFEATGSCADCLLLTLVNRGIE